MRRRNRAGRVRIDFDKLVSIAGQELEGLALATLADRWELSRKSSLHRRGDGTFTLCLIWTGVSRHGTSLRLSSTIRGLSVDGAR